MQNFEDKPEPKNKPKPIIWNILTFLVLLGACGLAYIFYNIFTNPDSAYNPFPPKLLPTVYLTPTPTATIIQLPATWTPTLTTMPSPTRTKAPTWTPVSELITPTETVMPEETLTSETTELPGSPAISPTAMPASADITYAASTDIHPDLGCDWAGVGGKVLDANGQPLRFQTVQLGGSLGTQIVNSIVISGSNAAYGTAGFEFDKLADSPVNSVQSLWIQLFDNKGTPLTQKIYFDTYADCSENLVMVVFTLNP